MDYDTSALTTVILRWKSQQSKSECIQQQGRLIIYDALAIA
jgi:hypothetical protein